MEIPKDIIQAYITMEVADRMANILSDRIFSRSEGRGARMARTKTAHTFFETCRKHGFSREFNGNEDSEVIKIMYQLQADESVEKEIKKKVIANMRKRGLEHWIEYFTE